MTKESVKRSKRQVRCPICGKQLCQCGEFSDVDVSCKNCNSNLTVMTKNNRIMVCEADAFYMA